MNNRLIAILSVAALACVASADDSFEELLGQLKPNTAEIVMPLARRLKANGATVEQFIRASPGDFNNLETVVEVLKAFDRAEGPLQNWKGGEDYLVQLPDACRDFREVFGEAIIENKVPEDSDYALMFHTCRTLTFDENFRRQLQEAHSPGSFRHLQLAHNLEELEKVIGWSDEQIEQSKWNIEFEEVWAATMKYINENTKVEGRLSIFKKPRFEDAKAIYNQMSKDDCKRIRNLEDILWLAREGVRPSDFGSVETKFLFGAAICEQLTKFGIESLKERWTGAKPKVKKYQEVDEVDEDSKKLHNKIWLMSSLGVIGAT